jgi:site-specific DNA-cytosine methylase
MDAFLSSLRLHCLILRDLKRQLVVVEPCAGLGGFEELSRCGDFMTKSHKFEVDCDLDTYYASRDMTVNTGVAGDILRQGPPHDNVEGAVAGPPCQHLNTSGERLGTHDPRSEVFERYTDWIIELAWSGTLIWLGIENSANINSVPGTSPGRSYAQEFLDKLMIAVPFFWFESCVLCAMPTIPIDRTRWWLRALRDFALTIFWHVSENPSLRKTIQMHKFTYFLKFRRVNLGGGNVGVGGWGGPRARGRISPANLAG